jgi:hypothetical protein
LRDLLARDYVGMILGEKWDRRKTIGLLKDGWRYHSMKKSDVNIRIYGRTAVETGWTRNSATSPDKEKIEGYYAYTTVWVRRDRRWQAVSYHVT